MFDRSRKGEYALLIQPLTNHSTEDGALEEFADLTRSAGATVAGTLTVRINRPNPSTLIGCGKLKEIKGTADATGADLILINHALSPVQERNLERSLERRVIDRTGLILDIFAQRACSHEGKLQVELAQLRHLATRLVRGWTHLERQRGGSIGLRGPGETQLETDRRLLQKRVEQLQKRLGKVEVQRTQMSRARVRSELPRIALVGYTNAGKSTLFNALTGASAYTADQLFATLDPKVRRIVLPGGSSAMLADTVGFVRNLPHELVAAFRSTLSEAREADLLLHVIDAADPLREERINQVDEVLQAVGAGELPQLLVFNKIDRIEGAEVRQDAQYGIPDLARRERVWLSAHHGHGLELLQQVLSNRLKMQHVQGELRLLPSAGRLRARLHQLNGVREEQTDEYGGWLLHIDLPLAEVERLAASDDGAPLRALLQNRCETWDPSLCSRYATADTRCYHT
ncbi:GTPase HflX [Xylella taiwanensis]|uniref:GTPase HflX n=1 Tax=Xylella taiwanensis TaxID=1444770 RepID=Z9JIU5_9GAMM|nr:ribosome rescue GTPase HflX [Xylella taiwanensis]AXI82538.1 GTPase HflX [Xylella taiwanensis]EWS77672.1 GTPase HflX [Xylella taiwanensis]MCD8455527.1 GTPase HflX [Xylella taiwanensis]MCD8457935.1 GTPase HflX [Xylella taiwanensis]MCD8460069.1 GTPase HflX [Xylella taiwanensis]